MLHDLPLSSVISPKPAAVEMIVGLRLDGALLVMQPILLARIPGGIQSGGTPFMVLEMALVAPRSILTGIWLWRRQPRGAALTGIFLIKAITLMSGFLVADYLDWFAGRLQATVGAGAFTVIYLLVYFFTWNYFAASAKRSGNAEISK